MLAYVASLWIVGVVCLVASVVGSSVKLGGSEIPAIPSSAARLAVALIGALALALGLVLLLKDSSTSGPPGNSAPGSGAPPPSHSSGTQQATTTADAPNPNPPTTNPPTTTPVRVRWHGTLVLGGYGGTGGGWFLDPAPPTEAVTGDVYFGDANTIIGNAIGMWDGPGPPQQQQCSDLLGTRLGQHRIDVKVGSVACFKTRGGLVGHLTVDRTPEPNHLTPSMTIEATVWERR